MNRTQRKEEIKSILWQAMAPNQEPMPRLTCYPELSYVYDMNGMF